MSIESGNALRDALAHEAEDWFSSRKAGDWANQPDEVIIGRKLSTACYIDQAFPAALYLAWKYHDAFTDGIVANAMVGGDNCHRGAIVGALLGAANGVEAYWLDGLRSIHAPSSQHFAVAP
jgi:ADP-ribosylglycohydrolase